MSLLNKCGVEIERKFLIKFPKVSLLEKKGPKTDIEQTYLTGEELSRRVRRTVERGISAYYYCEKRSINARRRTEDEILITQEHYNQLLTEAKTGTLKKTRYLVYYLQQPFVIDIYPFWKDRAILEIELSFEDEEIHFPSFVEIIAEVTEDKAYSNYSLANHFFPLSK